MSFVENWLKAHGLTLEELLSWRVQVDLYHRRFLIPVYSVTGELAFMLERNFDHEPKYSVQPPGSRRGFVLYGLYTHSMAVMRDKVAMAVEGFSDLLAITKVGITNSVSLLGSQMTEVQYSTMTALADEVVLWLDGDAAGRSEASEASLRHERVTGVVVRDYDPAEFVAAGGDVSKVTAAYFQYHKHNSFIELDFYGRLIDSRRR